MQWFSDFFKQRQRRREISDNFQQYGPSKAVIKDMVANPDKYTAPPMAEGPVGFLLVAVTTATAIDTSTQICCVTSQASAKGWLIQSIVSNVVVLTDGTLPSQKAAIGRHALAAQIVGALQSHVKIVHGVQVCSYGTYGGGPRLVYGALLPCFLDAMAMLHALEYGKVSEYIDPVDQQILA
jgi:hypothetical protein